MSDLGSDFERYNDNTSEEEISDSDTDSDEGNTSILIDFSDFSAWQSTDCGRNRPPGAQVFLLKLKFFKKI